MPAKEIEAPHGSNFVKDLKKSRIEKKLMEKKYGFIPLSILHLHRGSLTNRMFLFQREHQERGCNPRRLTATDNMTQYTKERQIQRMKVGSSIPPAQIMDRRKNGSKITISIMPAELVEFFIKYYTDAGQTYLDPFMGQGVQMQVSKIYGRHYYGYDISEEFIPYIRAVRDKIDDGSVELEITCGDSRTPFNIPDGIGDFCFTSPPYWDVEYYGEEDGQLGYQRGYEEFLKGMEDVARAWLPKFKPGAYMVVNTNDFRKDKVVYPYHADTIKLFQKAGWIYHDMWIVEGLVGTLPRAYGVGFNKKRIAPKQHEYCIVFRAPSSPPSSSPHPPTKKKSTKRKKKEITKE